MILFHIQFTFMLFEENAYTFQIHFISYSKTLAWSLKWVVLIYGPCLKKENRKLVLNFREMDE